VTDQPRCSYCHDRPATFWGTYCDECQMPVRQTQWVTPQMERRMTVAYAERIIRYHQRRNQV
jgi:hypothetical protein